MFNNKQILEIIRDDQISMLENVYIGNEPPKNIKELRESTFDKFDMNIDEVIHRQIILQKVIDVLNEDWSNGDFDKKEDI